MSVSFGRYGSIGDRYVLLIVNFDEIPLFELRLGKFEIENYADQGLSQIKDPQKQELKDYVDLVRQKYINQKFNVEFNIEEVKAKDYFYKLTYLMKDKPLSKAGEHKQIIIYCRHIN